MTDKGKKRNPRSSITTLRRARGKDSVEKGHKFEEAVANIYRLLGADVIQGVTVCQKKVDILATFRIPGSSSVHRVIVECKDEKKAVAQNSRVMEFTGLLDTARKAGEADSAEIITRIPWSEAAKGFALTAGVQVLTYSQKLSQLIDFTDYLSDLIDRFKKPDSGMSSDPPLAAYYVNLSAERNENGQAEKIPVLDNYLHKWLLQSENQRPLAILGEYGAGKSSLCLKIAHDLAVKYINGSHTSRIPILVNLREFTKTLKIESLFSSFLDEECGVINPRFKLFKAMNDAGIFLLIFDGFDEMAVRVDTETMDVNLREIEKLAASPLSKVILTSRPEYFISSEEEGQILNPRLALIRTREMEYEPIRVLPWDEEQIEEFLKKRVPLIKEATESWDYYKNHINGLPDLQDMSQRPVLLEMIVKTLPDLVKSRANITLNNLYELYLLGELKRQKVLKRRTLLIRDDDRLSMLKSLALDFFCGDVTTLNYTEALERVANEINPPRDEWEAYTRDFLSSSFLIRKGNEYHFSHKSILDYLIATKLSDEIKSDNPQRFGRAPINELITNFLTNYKPNADTLWKWVAGTKKNVDLKSEYLGGNAATLLVSLAKSALAGKDLSGTNLTGGNLSGADLRETNFQGTILKNVSLQRAKFLEKDISLAVFSDVIISFFLIAKVGFTQFTSVEKLIALITNTHLLDKNERSNKHPIGLLIELGPTSSTILLSIQVGDFSELESTRKLLASELSTGIAVYTDERETLEKNLKAARSDTEITLVIDP